MTTYDVYLKVYDTPADYRRGNYHHVQVRIQAGSQFEAEKKASLPYFSASLVNIREVDDAGS